MEWTGDWGYHQSLKALFTGDQMISKAISFLALEKGASQEKADPTMGIRYPNPEALVRTKTIVEYELHSHTMWPGTSHNPSGTQLFHSENVDDKL